jgi:hypothetical protein
MVASGVDVDALALARQTCRTQLGAACSQATARIRLEVAESSHGGPPCDSLHSSTLLTFITVPRALCMSGLR